MAWRAWRASDCPATQELLPSLLSRLSFFVTVQPGLIGAFMHGEYFVVNSLLGLGLTFGFVLSLGSTQFDFELNLCVLGLTLLPQLFVLRHTLFSLSLQCSFRCYVAILLFAALGIIRFADPLCLVLCCLGLFVLCLISFLFGASLH